MTGKTEKERASAEMKNQIDENLRQVYKDVLKQDLPDRFVDLLDQLRKKGAGA